MNWDFKQWSALAAAADCGSFEQAAVQLNITASAVSKRIRDLEETAGALLITRARPCRPTAQGQQLLRYWRQVVSLQQALAHELQQRPPVLSLAANHDSLDTWLLPVLAEAAADGGLLLDIQVEDQDHTRALLAEGRVMAAVSSEAETLRGCEVHALGGLRYRLMAAPAFAARYFSDGLTPAALRRAPLLVFNRKDDLQADFLRRHLQADAAMCPTHYVPSSHAFLQAVRMGLGYGMLFEQQLQSEQIKAGELLDLCPQYFIDVPLFWHCWQAQPPKLQSLRKAVQRSAAVHLTAVQSG
ncbi:LysR family transcriptional regulator ArgP [Uruburuella testudinis]|uniref:LysR family transcriptional regulator ArgP n=1 Tax=Uruburuella testudinis TaxID=1282863 RepID=A0ABY4DPT8_9NEIS|nr:LysR family transcriptional regulator ArgP [Uruburuella testudinis]UOO80744.1 LysR family transcriptional regulator ArgP [Uruburuella testudinis]